MKNKTMTIYHIDFVYAITRPLYNMAISNKHIQVNDIIRKIHDFTYRDFQLINQDTPIYSKTIQEDDLYKYIHYILQNTSENDYINIFNNIHCDYTESDFINDVIQRLHNLSNTQDSYKCTNCSNKGIDIKCETCRHNIKHMKNNFDI